MLSLIILGIIAFLIAFGLTPLVRALSLRMGLVDAPDQARKLHKQSTPRLGGIAIFAAYACAFAVAAFLPFGGHPLFGHSFGSKWWLFAAVTVVFATGVLDDLLTLRPKQKLLGQVIAAVLVWCGGIEVNLFHSLPDGYLLSLPVTVAWLIGCTNAFNLIDGLDGLASGAGLFACLTMVAAGLLTHNYALATVAVPLAASLLAFLCFNFNPASIFLGDCGSLTIGFLLGCFGMMWGQGITTVIGLSAPLIAVSIPLLDTSIAIVRRLLRNRPIFSPDRGHIHHRLLDRGNSVKKTALLLYTACAAAAGLALTEQFVHGQFANVALVVFATLVVAGIEYLGYMEFRVASRLVTQRVLFRMIEAEMKLDRLQTHLAQAADEHDAINLIRAACLDLGVENTFVVRDGDEVIEILRDLPGSQVNLPIDAERTLILHGLPPGNNPLPIERLASLIRTHFLESNETRTPAEAILNYRFRGLRPVA